MEILFQYSLKADYQIISPNSLIFFPNVFNHRPDLLDIVLVWLLHKIIHITNLNALSSNHKPILFSTQDAPITLSLPPSNHRINWKKFQSTLEEFISNTNPQTNTIKFINVALRNFIINLKLAIETCFFNLSIRPNKYCLPLEIAQEIFSKIVCATKGIA